MAQALCAGDCNGDGLVGVDEVVRYVTLALGTNQYRVCPPGDVNGDRSVTVDELLQAVGSTLEGCPATATVHRAAELSTAAGPQGLGHGVLPNGRRIAPAGMQIPTETLPLNVVLTADGRSLLVTNDGYSNEDNEQFVQVIDTQTLAVTKSRRVALLRSGGHRRRRSRLRRQRQRRRAGSHRFAATA